ncbi:MAG TPA: hypothetical protein VHK67_01055 [Rhabdochlamydiaceae bacterium]|jgi:hypothetical protein|nr:hypothetical protein [Rhabdochlamydiaceae bacterium]
MCTKVKIRAFNAILPAELIQRTATDKKTLMGAATFVANLIEDTNRTMQDRLLKGFDAFPGDRLCHARVMILSDLFDKPDVCTELQALIKNTQAEMVNLEISSDVSYLISCRLLKITRAVKSIEPSGIVLAKTDHKQLATLSKELSGMVLDKITRYACTKMSKETMERLQEYGRRMQVAPPYQRMLDHVVVATYGGFAPRTFGCQFFTVKLAMMHLLEKSRLLTIKTIVPEGPSQLFFFMPQKTDFVFEKAPQLEKTAFVTIFQAVVPSEKAVIEKIQEIGFIELILRYSAQLNPFEHTSTLDDIKDLDGRAVIEEYRKKAAESGCDEKLMQIHHLYCNTIQEEVK